MHASITSGRPLKKCARATERECAFLTLLPAPYPPPTHTHLANPTVDGFLRRYSVRFSAEPEPQEWSTSLSSYLLRLGVAVCSGFGWCATAPHRVLPRVVRCRSCLPAAAPVDAARR